MKKYTIEDIANFEKDEFGDNGEECNGDCKKCWNEI